MGLDTLFEVVFRATTGPWEGLGHLGEFSPAVKWGWGCCTWQFDQPMNWMTTWGPHDWTKKRINHRHYWPQLTSTVSAILSHDWPLSPWFICFTVRSTNIASCKISIEFNDFYAFPIYSYGPLPVISTNKAPFIGCKEGRYGLVGKTHPSCVRPGFNTGRNIKRTGGPLPHPCS